MSIQSKARRDAKKRKAAKAVKRPANRASPIEPHADLRDAAGVLLGGIVRSEGEWTLGLGGRIVGASDSPARVLAMLQRAAALHEREGRAVKLQCSPTLAAAVQADVLAQGVSYADFKTALEAELTAGGAELPASIEGDAVKH